MFDPLLAFNSTAIFNCNDGYTTVEETTVTCLSSGQQSKPEFCYPNCLMPAVEHADIITFDATLAFNTTATLQCKEGFDSITPLSITCESVGQWSKAECFRHCSDPPMISNALVQRVASPYTVNRTVEYTCNAGYYAPSPTDSVISYLSDGSCRTKTGFV